MPEKNEFLEKLKNSGLLKRASEIEGKRSAGLFPIGKVFPGGVHIETPFQRVFRVRTVFGPDEKIGRKVMGDFFSFRKNFASLLGILGRNGNLASFEIDKLLFFDVESTGLSSGAGNMVFLIGLGYFGEKEEFLIEQYFIEDFSNEQGLLCVLKDIFERKKHLVSFNGRSFDFHILKNRFILSRRFEFTLDNLLHFDLLHSSRRMWKDLVEPFSLNNLERGVLGLERTDEDVPGYLVPEFYRNYLRTGNAKELEKIFYHNLMDVKSMLGLLIAQLENLSLVLKGQFPDGMNHAGMAGLVRELDSNLYVSLLLHHAGTDRPGRARALRQLYGHYKSQKSLKEMRELLQRMLDESGDFDYYIYKELSIFWERYERKYELARDILHSARERMMNLEKLRAGKYDEEIDDTVRRLDRLEKKCLKK